MSTLRFPILLSFAFACGPMDRETETEDPAGGPDAGDWGGGGGGGATERCNKMDLLFVIDDSGSMTEEQDNLADNFDDFITVIDGYQTESGEPLDYRVAVTTSGRDIDYEIDPAEVCVPGLGCVDPPALPSSENGDNGAFRQKPACDLPRRWIERSDADVSGMFACNARVGTGGPSIEMPLHTAELAFTERMSDGTNQGFLREDALLALVIISDEDDCSRTDNNFSIESDSCHPEWPENPAISYYTGFLDTLKGERGRWATAVIAGPGPGTCESDFGEAFPARRLRRFVDETGENAVFSSICDGDLATGLGAALDTFSAACESFPPVD
jgi:hypothetical protein